MRLNSNIKRTCSFFVSKIHLVTMILPYIYKKIKKNEKIKTILEYNLNNEVDLLISKINFKEEMKKCIGNIDWKKTKIEKNVIEEKDIFLIVGSNSFINEHVNILYKEKEKNFSIITCYEVHEKQNNMKEVLNENEYLLNTTGEILIETI